MRRGIDVSHWQGDIDWAAVDGVEFAILKAGGSDAGFYKDAKFERNYEGAKAAGIPVGAYYFVGPYCTSYADGEADAKRFAEILKGKQFEYPVYIDLEATGIKDKAGATMGCIGFVETMQRLGWYCGIYASDLSGFCDRLDISKLGGIDKWVARYGSKPVYVRDYGMWQSGDKGKVNGIQGNVDTNEAYMDYPSIIRAAGLNGLGPEGKADEATRLREKLERIKAILEE